MQHSENVPNDRGGGPPTHHHPSMPSTFRLERERVVVLPACWAVAFAGSNWSGGRKFGAIRVRTRDLFGFGSDLWGSGRRCKRRPFSV